MRKSFIPTVFLLFVSSTLLAQEAEEAPQEETEARTETQEETKKLPRFHQLFLDEIQKDEPNAHTIRSLVYMGVPANLSTEKGDNGLHLAIKRDDADLARFFLKHLVDPDKPDSKGKTPLELADSQKSKALVLLLESFWADTSGVNLEAYKKPEKKEPEPEPEPELEEITEESEE